MVALDPRLSGKLDRVLEIARPRVADPENDGIVYSVKRGGEIVKNWQAYGHEMAGNTIRLRLDLGLNQEFAAAVGVFPVGTQIFYRQEDGTEDRYTIVGYLWYSLVRRMGSRCGRSRRRTATFRSRRWPRRWTNARGW